MPAKKSSAKRAPKASRPQIPGYGLAKGTKGLLPWSWAEQRLKKSHNYWITTVRPDGSPHTMVVWGLWNDNRFLFSTGGQSRKAKNLAQNPHCIVATEKAAEAVIVEGEAAAANPDERNYLLTQYAKKYKWDMSAMREEPIFSVRPQTVFGLWEKHFQGKSTRWKFD